MAPLTHQLGTKRSFFTSHWLGLAALLAFVVAYGLAVAEERLHVRKSVPVLSAAALVWIVRPGP